jgi:hypothetical protein
LSYIVSVAVTNVLDDIVSRPFGYPNAALRPGDPGAANTNTAPKRVHLIRHPTLSWAMTDADQLNAVTLAAYYPFLPTKKAHGELRNQLYFDWHIEAVRR